MATPWRRCCSASAADWAAADDQQVLGHIRQRQSTGGAHDAPAGLKLRTRKRNRSRTGGNNGMLKFDVADFAIVQSRGIGTFKLRPSLQQLNAASFA